ncbi:hypothetical protein MTR_1g105230 [Medicago truncatula]|uniref:Uncharacterized protein n=1 Tax=Medicago truncatula TaxID=3880 RepID=G7IE42_MEDTR|nr:hypothetical protein MTR_1g105230 [Medicago truncatula]
MNRPPIWYQNPSANNSLNKATSIKALSNMKYQSVSIHDHKNKPPPPQQQESVDWNNLTPAKQELHDSARKLDGSSLSKTQTTKEENTTKTPPHTTNNQEEERRWWCGGSRNRRALILGWAYYLDAFSSYPLRTWLPSVYRWHDNWYTKGAFKFWIWKKIRRLAVRV